MEKELPLNCEYLKNNKEKMEDKVQFLLVDDSEFDLFLNKELIATGEIPAFVQSFKSAEDALDYIIKAGDDLPESIILLDLQMPVMNGFEFVEQFSVLSESLKKKIKIFMLSSTADREDVEKAKANDHIIDILSKPLNVELLKKRLKLLSVIM
jgi:response regulator RpfG family c-di-GMP phosphodiesterase